VTTVLRAAVVGDYDREAVAHRANTPALELAGGAAAVRVVPTWIPTDTIDPAAPDLEAFDGVWSVPVTPYRSAAGAIAAIRFARERGVPFLGTCGGFQHAVLEIAGSLWGIERPTHAEDDPASAEPIIAPLACSLIEQGGRVRFAPGSRLATAYGRLESDEEYHCSYGLGSRCQRFLEAGPLRATSWDDQGEVRGVELDGDRFFVGTLFQPERIALRGVVPPIVAAFVAAMAYAAKTRV
jgi:CTP synthase (UTP-ammonia lyase)